MANIWENLPTDLLLLILNSETLAVTDVISFSSVCTSWRHAATSSQYQRRFRHQSPWLMFVGEEDPKSAQLYSFSNNKVYSIPNQPDPPIANRIFIGSAHGWLITADDKSELSLLNPITRQQIELPPIATLKPIVHYIRRGKFTGYQVKRIRLYTPEYLRFELYVTATISSPPVSVDYVVVLLLRDHLDHQTFAFTRAGDKKWTVLDTGPDFYDHYPRRRRRRVDIAFHDDGKLYIASGASLEACDFNQKDLRLIKTCWVSLMPTPSLYRYLVRGRCGELLLVLWDKDDSIAKEVWSIGYDRKVIKLESLGDYALFLGGNNSICVSSKDNPQAQGNCLYIFDEYTGDDEYRRDRDSPPNVCIFSLKDGSTERILPNDSRMNWPPPIWIMA